MMMMIIIIIIEKKKTIYQKGRSRCIGDGNDNYGKGGSKDD